MNIQEYVFLPEKTGEYTGPDCLLKRVLAEVEPLNKPDQKQRMVRVLPGQEASAFEQPLWATWVEDRGVGFWFVTHPNF